MEQIPNPEINKDAVILVLKNLGIENTGARELLVKWTEQQEQKAEALGTREAQLDFEFEKAEIYFSLGPIDVPNEVSDGVSTFVDVANEILDHAWEYCTPGEVEKDYFKKKIEEMRSRLKG